MTTRVVAAAAAIAIVVTALPPASAWAQVEHAQRVALEVAVRRAQVRAALCAQQQRQPPGTVTTAPRLPSSPPVGTAGIVALGDCSNRLWPFGR